MNGVHSIGVTMTYIIWKTQYYEKTHLSERKIFPCHAGFKINKQMEILLPSQKHILDFILAFG